MNNRKHHPKREELLRALRRQAEGSDLNADYEHDEFTRKALSGLRRHGDVEKALERLDKRVLHQGRKPRNTPLLWVPLAIAAACALALWVLPATPDEIVGERAPAQEAFIGADADGLAVELGRPLPLMALSRTRSMDIPAADEALADAIARYRQGDFEGAIPLFAHYASMTPEEKDVRLFWGHALLQTQPREAMPILSSLAADAEIDPAIGAQASYLLAWAYVKVGDISEGRQYFERLAKAGGDLSAKAGVMLGALSAGGSFMEHEPQPKTKTEN